MTSSRNDKAITVALTGASGTQYGMRLIECLVRADHSVYVMFTKAAQIVVGSETEYKLPGRTAEQTRYLSSLFGAKDGQLRVFGDEEWTSPVASGSGAPRRMVVCPASMATVSAIATGASENLLERAADVVIKDHRAEGNAVLGDSSREHAEAVAARRRDPARQSRLLQPADAGPGDRRFHRRARPRSARRSA